MLLTYLDDSGEAGIQLWAAVIVREQDWLPMLDAWTDYRRWLRANFGLRISKGTGRRVPVELHATDFHTGAGDWRHLPVNRDARVRAFRAGLRLIGRHANVFAVAWVPSRPISTSYQPFHVSPAVDCWTIVLERLQTYSTRAPNERVVTFIDQGYGVQFTRTLRRMRRFHYVGSQFGGALKRPAARILDDPVVRNSKESPFIQMADLCAYAALRELRPLGPSSNLWQELGGGIVWKVNSYQKTQPPGIKLMPP